MKLDSMALGSLFVLVAIFVISFVLLQRTIKGTKIQPQTGGPERRILNEEDRMRIARRMEREALREQRELERNRQRDAYESARPSAYAEKLRLREEERLAKEAEEMKNRLDRERKEKEEFKRWRSQISVTDDGQEEILNDKIIEEFVDTLNGAEVIILEDMASRFGISIQQVIQRIGDLEQQGKIRGCLDDRGRYITTRKDMENRLQTFLREASARTPISTLPLIFRGNIEHPT